MHVPNWTIVSKNVSKLLPDVSTNNETIISNAVLWMKITGTQVWSRFQLSNAFELAYKRSFEYFILLQHLIMMCIVLWTNSVLNNKVCVWGYCLLVMTLRHIFITSLHRCQTITNWVHRMKHMFSELTKWNMFTKLAIISIIYLGKFDNFMDPIFHNHGVHWRKFENCMDPIFPNQGGPWTPNY